MVIYTFHPVILTLSLVALAVMWLWSEWRASRRNRRETAGLIARCARRAAMTPQEREREREWRDDYRAWKNDWKHG